MAILTKPAKERIGRSSGKIAQAPGATNPRAYSPAAPIGALVGVRVRF